MGKIRLKTIGDEGQEEQDKQKAKVKREEKKLREAKSSSAGDSEKAEIVTDDSKEEEKIINSTSTNTETEEKTEAPRKAKKEKFIKKSNTRGANYTSNAMLVDKNKIYSLAEGIELLKNLKTAKFDETVELHINTTEAGISGNMTLPHGTGKEIKVAIANDEILAEVEKGKINFDVLIATPAQMPTLAKVARVLGPRGLMPNPKNGTISDKPEEAAKKFQGGQISFKTESKLPLIHLSVGKLSFKDSDLKENITTAISAVKKNRIKNITLKSTMSPGIKLSI